MLAPLLLATWLACSAPPPTPTPVPRPAGEKKPPVRAKAKTGNMAPGKAKQPARGGKAKAAPTRGAPMPDPVGAQGVVQGELVLLATEVPAAPPTPPPTPPAEGAPPAPPPVEGAPRAVTDASMILTWGDEGKAQVSLGQVDGTCTSIDPVPVGPQGKQHTPLWTVRCDDAGKSVELYVLQVNNLLAVVRMEGTAGPGAYKVVRRVPLVAGAKLEKKGAVEAAPPPAP